MHFRDCLDDRFQKFGDWFPGYCAIENTDLWLFDPTPNWERIEC